MPQWIPEELRQGDALAAIIAGSPLPRRRAPLTSPLRLRLSEALQLVPGLAGTTRALPVRQLLRALGFGEERTLAWRMEHKLRQALILRAFVPDAIPVTCGLGSLGRGASAEELRTLVEAQFPDGYILKSALGDSSGELPDRDSPNERARILQAAVANPIHEILDERFIAQQRIPIATEYRVHSLEDGVIEDLTFRRYDAGSIPGERDKPNAFVQQVLKNLPDGLVGGSLLAWDIALQPSGVFAIIEVNFSGFQPAFKRGFHCSGYFHDQHWGSCDTARLLNYVALQDGVEVRTDPDAPEHPMENRFYSEVAIWQRRHRGQTVFTA